MLIAEALCSIPSVVERKKNAKIIYAKCQHLIGKYTTLCHWAGKAFGFLPVTLPHGKQSCPCTPLGHGWGWQVKPHQER